MLKRVMFLALICACGASDDVEESESTQAVGSGGSGSGKQRSGDECDPTPIDEKGTLPACVAGRSGSNGPGKAVDAVIVAEPPPTPEEVEATTRANQLTNARNPTHQDAADRGFAPARAKDGVQ